jgi:hypothetical protein
VHYSFAGGKRRVAMIAFSRVFDLDEHSLVDRPRSKGNSMCDYVPGEIIFAFPDDPRLTDVLAGWFAEHGEAPPHAGYRPAG